MSLTKMAQKVKVQDEELKILIGYIMTQTKDLQKDAFRILSKYGSLVDDGKCNLKEWIIAIKKVQSVVKKKSKVPVDLLASNFKKNVKNKSDEDKRLDLTISVCLLRGDQAKEFWEKTFVTANEIDVLTFSALIKTLDGLVKSLFGPFFSYFFGKFILFMPQILDSLLSVNSKEDIIFKLVDLVGKMCLKYLQKGDYETFEEIFNMLYNVLNEVYNHNFNGNNDHGIKAGLNDIIGKMLTSCVGKIDKYGIKIQLIHKFELLINSIEHKIPYLKYLLDKLIDCFNNPFNSERFYEYKNYFEDIFDKSSRDNIVLCLTDFIRNNEDESNEQALIELIIFLFEMKNNTEYYRQYFIKLIQNDFMKNLLKEKANDTITYFKTSSIFDNEKDIKDALLLAFPSIISSGNSKNQVIHQVYSEQQHDKPNDVNSNILKPFKDTIQESVIDLKSYLQNVNDINQQIYDMAESNLGTNVQINDPLFVFEEIL